MGEITTLSADIFIVSYGSTENQIHILRNLREREERAWQGEMARIILPNDRKGDPTHTHTQHPQCAPLRRKLIVWPRTILGSLQVTELVLKKHSDSWDPRCRSGPYPMSRQEENEGKHVMRPVTPERTTASRKWGRDTGTR